MKRRRPSAAVCAKSPASSPWPTKGFTSDPTGIDIICAWRASAAARNKSHRSLRNNFAPAPRQRVGQLANGLFKELGRILTSWLFFLICVDLDDNSISGSESSSSSDSSTSSSATSSEAQEDPGQQAATLQARKTPLAWFVAPGYEPGAQFGIYRAAIPSVQPKSLAPPQGWTEALRQQQVTPHVPLNKKDKAALPEVAAPENGCATTPFEHRSWAVFMIGGGHFAAAVLSLVPKITKQSGKFEREVEVLAHKTIHRYTSAFTLFLPHPLPALLNALSRNHGSSKKTRWCSIFKRSVQVQSQERRCPDQTVQ